MKRTMTRIRKGEGEKRGRGEFGFRGFALILFLATLAAACGANQGVLNSGKESPTRAVAVASPDSFEKELGAMNDVNFTWIYVLRRKDGGELDSGDKAFVRANASDANRRVLSDDGKALIIGTNYNLGDANLKALKDRFDFRDVSAPQQTSPTPEVKKSTTTENGNG